MLFSVVSGEGEISAAIATVIDLKLKGCLFYYAITLQYRYLMIQIKQVYLP